MRKIFLLLSLFGTFQSNCFSKILDIQAPGQCALYDRADYKLKLEGHWSNPYLQEDVRLDMLFVSPDGKEGLLPCFFDGFDWASRFAPQVVGEYKVRFVLYEKGEKTDESSTYSLVVNKSDLKGFLHPRDNWTLQFDNGELFRGVGENICWESRVSDDNQFSREYNENADLYNYDVMLPKLARFGGNFTRMWMCSWNFPIDRQSNFNNKRYEPTAEYFNPSAIERLDHVMDLAESLNIKIMLCMGQGDVRADSTFFTSDRDKTRYRNRLRYIVARWGYSPSVAMWEFFNEIDNIQFADSKHPIPASYIVEWHSEMAKYLREIDPYNHIITTSISHRDLTGLNDIPEIDINQKHIYRNVIDIPKTIIDYTSRHGKPYIIGEAGYEWDWNLNFENFVDGMNMDFTRAMWYGIFNPTPVTPMSWWWEWFDRKGTMARIADIRAISDKMMEAGNGTFEQLKVVVEGNEGYAVKCGKKIFVYIFNPGKNIIKEATVVDGARNRKLRGLKIEPLKEQVIEL